MDELQRWLDMAPAQRTLTITFANQLWTVEVCDVRLPGVGRASEPSLWFAAVAAILDFRSKLGT